MVVSDSVGPAITLTDEELEVLVGEVPPVVHPYLARLPAQVRDTARVTARRSLAARGLLLQEDETGGRTWPGLAALLELRGGAPVVAVVHRLVGAPAEASGPPSSSLSRYLHVCGEVVLTEDVTPEGVHSFGLEATDRLADLVAGFLVPAQAAPAPAPGRAVRVRPSPADPVPADLGDPTVMAEATVLHAAAVEPPPLLTVALGPRGCFLGRSGPEDAPLLVEVGAEGVVGEFVTEIHRAAGAVAVAGGDHG